MPERLALLPLLALLSLPACGKDEPKDPKPSGERTEEPVPETPKDAPTGPFAGFDFDGAAKAWQGAWVLPGSTLGQVVAWEVAGDKVTEHAAGLDGAGEDKTYEFAIYSPCQVTYTDAEAGVTTYHTFTFVGSTLHTGLGSAGTVIGEGDTRAVVGCIGAATYVLRGDTCEKWSEMFGDWKQEAADCKVEGEGAERKLVTPDGALPFVGEAALADTQMQGNVATKHADFAAAKAALSASKGGEPSPEAPTEAPADTAAPAGGQAG